MTSKVNSVLSRRQFLRYVAATAGAAAILPHLRILAQDADPSVTGKLTFWGHADHPLDDIREAFLEVYPNVELDWQHLDDYTPKFQTAMAAGTGAPDLFWSEAFMVQQYGSAGALLDVSDVIAKHEGEFIPGKLAEAYVPTMDAYFGVPGDLSVSGIYYRGDILDELGITIPEDMMYEEFLGILEQIAAAGKKAVLYPKGGTFVAAAQWSWFNAQFGGSGPATCDNQTMVMDSEPSIKAVELIKAIYDTGATLQADFWTPEYWNAINTGELVLDLCPAWARGFWETNLDPSVQGMWRLAPLPRAIEGGPRTAVWGGATLIATANTPNPDLAKLFMEFAFASMPGATAAGNWGIIPAYLPYLEGPFQEERTALFGEQNINEVWLMLAQELSTEFCRTAVYSAAVDEKLTPAIDSMITGGADIPSTMQGLNEELTAILPDYQ